MRVIVKPLTTEQRMEGLAARVARLEVSQSKLMAENAALTAEVTRLQTRLKDAKRRALWRRRGW